MAGGRPDDQVRRNVEKLLGIASAEELVTSLIERAALPGGWVESHEFGRDQHSSASAGAVLVGMAGVPSVSDMLSWSYPPTSSGPSGQVTGNGGPCWPECSRSGNLMCCRT